MFILSHLHISSKGNYRILNNKTYKNILKNHPILLLSAHLIRKETESHFTYCINDILLQVCGIQTTVSHVW